MRTVASILLLLALTFPVSAGIEGTYTIIVTPDDDATPDEFEDGDTVTITVEVDCSDAVDDADFVAFSLCHDVLGLSLSTIEASDGGGVDTVEENGRDIGWVFGQSVLAGDDALEPGVYELATATYEVTTDDGFDDFCFCELEYLGLPIETTLSNVDSIDSPECDPDSGGGGDDTVGSLTVIVPADDDATPDVFEVGDEFTVTIELDSSEGESSDDVSFALCHDLDALEIVSVSTDLDLFESPTIVTDEATDIDQGWYFTSSVANGDDAIAADVTTLATATYEVTADIVSDLCFCALEIDGGESYSTFVSGVDSVTETCGDVGSEDSGAGEPGPGTISVMIRTDEEYSVGDTVSVSVSVDTSDGADSSTVSFSLCHDLAAYELVSVSTELELSEDSGPFIVADDDDINVGWVFALSAILGDDALEPGVHTLATATYEITAVPEEEFCFCELEYLGVPVTTVVSGLDEITEECLGIEVEDPGQLFLRGDGDNNGVVFPILDALFILEYGFSGGPVPPCEDASDADGNNVVFPILDALYILDYGFNNGPAPPDPGPDTCGVDDDADEDVTCETSPDACA